jgi:hypothetical protein
LPRIFASADGTKIAAIARIQLMTNTCFIKHLLLNLTKIGLFQGCLYLIWGSYARGGDVIIFGLMGGFV